MKGFAAVSFGLVCLLSGSLWLLPVEERSPTAELSGFGLSSIVSFALIRIVCSRKRDAVQRAGSVHWRLALSGLAAIAAPTVMLWIGRHNLSSVMAVATQVGVPVVVAVATATLGAGGELQNQLLPSLVGLAGALLILPVALPQSSTGWTGLACYVAAAGCSGVGSIFCHREMTRVSPTQALLTVAGANAVCFIGFAVVWLLVTGSWHDALPSITLSGSLSIAAQSVSMAGITLLLRALSPLAFASRFIFIPLLATAEAALFLHLPLSPRAWMGAMLMLLGGVACLRLDSRQASSTTLSLQ